MKILVFSSEAWSTHSAEGLVFRKVISAMVELDHEVTLITPRPTGLSCTHELVVSNVIPEAMDKAIRVFSGVEKLIYVVRGALRARRIWNRLGPFDLVVSRSTPIAVHLAPAILVRAFRRRVPVLATFSDPGFINPYIKNSPALVRTTTRLIERATHRVSSLVAHTNHEVIKAYARRGVDTSKWIVFPNPFSPAQTDGVGQASQNSGSTRLAYVGAFYGRRQPDALFAYLRKAQEKSDFALSIVGGVRNIYYSRDLDSRMIQVLRERALQGLREKICEFGLQDIVTILPFMEAKQLEEYISQHVDVLVNIDAPTTGTDNLFLSSKIVEYLKYQKPILSFSNKGASVDFLRSVGIGRYVDYDGRDRFDLAEEPLSLIKPDRKSSMQYEASNLVQELLNRASAARDDSRPSMTRSGKR